MAENDISTGVYKNIPTKEAKARASIFGMGMIAAANARTNADVQNYMIHLGVGAEEFCDAQE